MDMHENRHPELGRISASLYIAESTGRGRGVFCNSDIRKGSIIEVSPVIVMSAGDRSLLDQTLLHDYIFEWGPGGRQCCMALGYVPLYNHSHKANCEYEMEFGKKHMADDKLVQTVWNIYDVVPTILQSHAKIKNPWPNVDAHSGALLVHFGMKEYEYYTVLFGVSRSLGVLASLCWDRALGYALERPKSVTTDQVKRWLKGQDEIWGE